MIGYVCSTAGIAPRRTSAAHAARRRQIARAPTRTVGRSAPIGPAEAEQVVVDEHLAVRVHARADADHRNGDARVMIAVTAAGTASTTARRTRRAPARPHRR